MNLHRSLLSLAVLLAPTAPASAGVIVVDAAGGGSFTQIQSAINAAVDGDTILVKPGNYTGFTIDAKALTVVGDVGLNTVSGRALVQNLPAGQTVTLANLKVFATGTNALRVLNCDGAVRIVSCEWYGQPQNLGGWVTNADSVALAGCTIVGGDGLQMGNISCGVGSGNGDDGGHAFHVENSSIAMYDSLTRGGKGGNGESETAPGGWGACLFSGFMFAGRSNVTGGNGGIAACADTCGNIGGYGWYVDAVASAWELDCMVSGGMSSSSGLGEFCPGGPPVQSAAYNAEVPFQFAAPNIGFTIPHVAREGTFVQVTFVGPPGAQVFLNDELTTTHEATASWRGVLLAPFADSVIGPAKSRRWGTIPASGELIKSYRVPTLAPGEQAQTRFLQAYRIGPNGLTLGTFRTLTVLDSAF